MVTAILRQATTQTVVRVLLYILGLKVGQDFIFTNKSCSKKMAKRQVLKYVANNLNKCISEVDRARDPR